MSKTWLVAKQRDRDGEKGKDGRDQDSNEIR